MAEISRLPRSRHRITWTTAERQAMIAALLGFHMKPIASRARLSVGQLYYRIGKLQLGQLRRDYRTLDSPIARRTIAVNTPYVLGIVRQRISETTAAKKSRRAA